MTEEQTFRPRFGVLYRHNGETRTVVFYPHESLPDTFVAHYADTEEVAVVDAKAGDRIQVDNLAPGQAVYINYPDKPGPVRGRLESDRNKEMAENENKPKDPNGWWKALLTLAGIAAIVVFTIAGINWATGL
jgi:hypothetical protein